jgi:hypothetical protein
VRAPISAESRQLAAFSRLSHLAPVVAAATSPPPFGRRDDQAVASAARRENGCVKSGGCNGPGEFVRGGKYCCDADHRDQYGRPDPQSCINIGTDQNYIPFCRGAEETCKSGTQTFCCPLGQFCVDGRCQ